MLTLLFLMWRCKFRSAATPPLLAAVNCLSQLFGVVCLYYTRSFQRPAVIRPTPRRFLLVFHRKLDLIKNNSQCTTFLTSVLFRTPHSLSHTYSLLSNCILSKLSMCNTPEAPLRLMDLKSRAPIPRKRKHQILLN